MKKYREDRFFELEKRIKKEKLKKSYLEGGFKSLFKTIIILLFNPIRFDKNSLKKSFFIKNRFAHPNLTMGDLLKQGNELTEEEYNRIIKKEKKKRDSAVENLSSEEVLKLSRKECNGYNKRKQYRIT